jgi:hypothetical protein
MHATEFCLLVGLSLKELSYDYFSCHFRGVVSHRKREIEMKIDIPVEQEAGL